MKEIIFAGLGGQGVLTVGLIVAEIANYRGDNVTWLPSYGSAMRGGAANCIVKYGKEVVYNPSQESCDILLAMHEQSLQEFEQKVVIGGAIIYNSDLMCTDLEKRKDVQYYAVPCASLASQIEYPRGANIIMAGVLLKASGDFQIDEGLNGMNAMFNRKGKAKFEEQNSKAFRFGFAYID